MQSAVPPYQMDFSQPFEDENRKRPNIELQLLQRLKLERTRETERGRYPVCARQAT